MEKYNEVYVKQGPRHRKGVMVALPAPDTTLRGQMRKRINKEVGDLSELVANAHNMISLIMSTISVIYSELIKTMSPEQLQAFEQNEPAKKALIEYAITKFSGTITTADIKFAQDPQGAVNELIDSQGQIGTIMKELKNI